MAYTLEAVIALRGFLAKGGAGFASGRGCRASRAGYHDEFEAVGLPRHRDIADWLP